MYDACRKSEREIGVDVSDAIAPLSQTLMFLNWTQQADVRMCVCVLL